MEFVWMIPLYIIIPVVGIIIFIKGYKQVRGQGRKRVVFGIILFSLPFLHSFLVSCGDWKNEKSLIGSYILDSTNEIVLRLKTDKTFELSRIDSLQNYGQGKWEYYSWDIEDLNLFFNDSSQLTFHIQNEDKKKYLETSFWTGSYHKYVKLIKVHKE